MPLKLTVGLARKVGRPNYGSLGASCALDLELDAGLLRDDPDMLHRRVRAAFDACARAVEDELGRPRPSQPGPMGDGPLNRDVLDAGTGRCGVADGRRRPATGPQVRALRAICDRRGLDLDGLVGERFGVDGPEELSVAEASRLIDELQGPPAGAPA